MENVYKRHQCGSYALSDYNIREIYIRDVVQCTNVIKCGVASERVRYYEKKIHITQLNNNKSLWHHLRSAASTSDIELLAKLLKIKSYKGIRGVKMTYYEIKY